MTQNRIKSFIHSEDKISSALKSATIPEHSDLEALFSGPQSFQDILHQEIEKAKQAGYQLGYTTALSDVANIVESKIEKYISEIIKVGSTIYNVARKEIADLKITHYQSRFCFDSESVNAFFVIDSSTEDELSFSNLLNKVEQLIFKEDNYVIEVHFVNQRNAEVDFATLKSDYPFSFNPASFLK